MSHLLTDKSLGGSALHAVFGIIILLLTIASPFTCFATSSSQGPSIFTKCWEFTINSNPGVAPAADASAVYFLDAENKLHAVDLAMGSNLWSADVGGEVVSNLLVIDDLVFLVATSQSEDKNSPRKAVVRAVSRETGVTVWQTDAPASETVWLGSVAGNVVVAGSAGTIAAFSRVDGKPVWRSELTSPVTSEPDFNESGIALATANREILIISTTSGSVDVAWKSEYLPTAVLTDPAGRLVVGDERGNLVLISPDGGRVWSFRNGAQISSSSLHNLEYLASSYDNFVYKLSRGGNVKWKRRLSGRVSDRPVILGDTAVVSIAGTGSIYALDLKNGKISNRIETGDDVTLRVAAAGNEQGFAVVGPRGILYYSSKCSGK